MIASIDKLNRQLHQAIGGDKELSVTIKRVREILAELALDMTWFHRFVEERLLSPDFMKQQVNTIWPNEICLYRSPERDFTVLAYVWEPRTRDVVHDHGAWGVISPVSQPLAERKYRRLDDGRHEDTAELKEAAFWVIAPGQATVVRPLDEGIHRLENAGAGHVLSVNVYGRSLGRGYVRFFDPETHRVWRAYRAATNKPVLFLRALAARPDSRAESLLSELQDRDLPEAIKEEGRRVLRQWHSIET
jgi:predicted metal-dependent enzyme (double-stranded beta helix superfamily)